MTLTKSERDRLLTKVIDQYERRLLRSTLVFQAGLAAHSPRLQQPTDGLFLREMQTAVKLGVRIPRSLRGWKRLAELYELDV